MNVPEESNSGGVALAGAILLALSLPAAADAAPNANWSKGSVLRARMYDNADGSGGTLTTWGSTPCTKSTATPDTTNSNLGALGWNDVISAVNDYNSCDTNLFMNGLGDTPLFGGYHNFGDGSPVYVGANNNDKASSYHLS